MGLDITYGTSLGPANFRRVLPKSGEASEQNLCSDRDAPAVSLWASFSAPSTGAAQIVHCRLGSPGSPAPDHPWKRINREIGSGAASEGYLEYQLGGADTESTAHIAALALCRDGEVPEGACGRVAGGCTRAEQCTE